jgi:NAD(P)-dependent dehydrogenase (short-subunit alcohol dehydrogenase family)
MPSTDFPYPMFKNTCFDLSGRSALVTGGSRGLGREMALLLARAGAEVAICSRTQAHIEAAAKALSAATGRRVEPLVADLGKRADTERLAREAVERLGKIDILISNAGWNIPQPVEAIRDQDWDALLELNLTSSMVLTRALAPGMIQRGWGRVIYISSIMALASTGDRVAYSTTKAGLNGMVKANALRLGPHGITVNCLAPGPFATEMPMSILTDQQKQAFAARTAVGRWGEPAELAPAALFLASNAASYTTGSVLVVDGGVTARMW